jgi:hypothetical protein
MLKTELRDYQSEAIKKALQYNGFCLFPEQRTGKTLVSLAILDQRKPHKLLVICPKKAIVVWHSEIEKHLQLDWPMEVEIVNFEQLVARKDQYYRRKAKGEWDGNSMIICDESHRIKRRGSKISRTLRRLSLGFTWRLALSGTPISPKKISRGKRSYVVEGLQDLWAQFDFVDPRIFGPYVVYDKSQWGGQPKVIGGFESRYCIRGGFKNHTIIGYRNRRLFDTIFEKYSYRVTMKEISPTVTKIRRIKKLFTLEAPAQQAYDQIKRDLETVINGRTISVPLVLSAAMKLQQITGGTLIDTGTRDLHIVGKEKLTVLRNLLKRRKKGEPWIIIARFIHEIENIQTLGRELSLKTIAISGKNVYDPIKCRESDIIILQIASGVAIDLSMASTTVYYSWDYSYINHEQSKFRMMSYGKKEITYYFLIAKDTVDELIYNAMTKKRDLATIICDHFRKKSK